MNDGNPSIFLGTFLATGDTNRLCIECLPQYLASFLAEITQTPLETIILATSGPAGDDELAEVTGIDDADRQAAMPDPPPRRKPRSGRSRPVSSDQATDADEDQNGTTEATPPAAESA